MRGFVNSIANEGNSAGTAQRNINNDKKGQDGRAVFSSYASWSSSRSIERTNGRFAIEFDRSHGAGD
jgi:hypothetical protein